MNAEAYACPPRCAKLAIYVPDLAAGGVSRVAVDLAAALSGRGHQVDLVLCRAAGPLLGDAPDAVNLVELQRSRLFPAYLLAAAPASLLPLLSLYVRRPRRTLPNLRYLPALTRYLRRRRPDALLAAKTMSNLLALWAARLAGVPTRIVISEHTHLSSEARREGWRCLLPSIQRTYRRAAARVAVSDGVAADLSQLARIPRREVATIYAALGARRSEQSETSPDHAWFRPDGPPVILAAGRLTAQKDFATLLRAFAGVRRRRPARLMILGEGALRAELERLAGALGVASDVAMPGWAPRPHAYMARAAVFVLSSVWEGLPLVVVEALAAGCPVVSTDCPSGPAEILGGGAYGRLVPVGDAAALAEAVVAALDEPPHRDRLRRRARHFSTDRAADRYLDVLLAGAP